MTPAISRVQLDVAAQFNEIIAVQLHCQGFYADNHSCTMNSTRRGPMALLALQAYLG